jgi:D-ribose pyranose/furanose isomerase RbsD
MRLSLALLLSVVTLMAVSSCRTQKPAATPPSEETANNENFEASWLEIFCDTLPVLGHRNWIVVADAAFPQQVSPGLEVIVAGEDHFQVLADVLRTIKESGHVSPKIYLDKELAFVDEKLAPGMDECRAKIAKLLAGYDVKPVLHEELLARLDQVAKTYKILMIKTSLALPYTTVFMELDCGYWGPENEAKLREAMKK